MNAVGNLRSNIFNFTVKYPISKEILQPVIFHNPAENRNIIKDNGYICDTTFNSCTHNLFYQYALYMVTKLFGEHIITDIIQYILLPLLIGETTKYTLDYSIAKQTYYICITHTICTMNPTYELVHIQAEKLKNMCMLLGMPVEDRLMILDLR